MAKRRGSGVDEIARLREQMAKGETTDAELLAEERRKQREAAHKREFKRILKAQQEEIDELKARQAWLDELAEIPEVDPAKIRPLKRKRGTVAPDTQATYFMLASDWHVGERVRPENVGHRNEYSPEIASERAAQFFDSNLTLLKMARSAWDIRQGVLWLGGDLMTGYIHEEYLEENFLSPNEECELFTDLVVDGINRLLRESDLDHILIPTSNGNHGRTGQRIKIASYAKNSFEWLAYRNLERMYRDEPRVKFQIASGYHNVVDVYGFRIGFHHGDAIGYAGGVGGLSIPVNRRIGRQSQATPLRWEGTEKDAPHLQCFGHFHQSLFPSTFVCNGSLIGWNDFAERIGCPFEDPAQTSFVVDETHRMVSNYNRVVVDKSIYARKK